MSADLTEEELKLLQSLEDEGLLSKNIASRIRTGLKIANVAGQKRARIVSGLALFFVSTPLWAACHFFCGVVGWAAVLTGLNAALFVVIGLYLLAGEL